MVINRIVGVYIPIIRILIKGGMTIPNIATFDHGTYDGSQATYELSMDHHALVGSHLTVFWGTSSSSQLFSRSQVWWFCWCCGMESMKKQKQWICWIECYPCFFAVYWKCKKGGGVVPWSCGSGPCIWPVSHNIHSDVFRRHMRIWVVPCQLEASRNCAFRWACEMKCLYEMILRMAMTRNMMIIIIPHDGNNNT